MKILVLGGAGFIGRLVLRRFVDLGHDVYCMDINPDKLFFGESGQSVKVCKGDISVLHDLLRIMIEIKPDRILNLAYYLPSSVTAVDDPDYALRINILGMNNCFEAARVCGIKRVTYASSLAVYGLQKLNGEKPLDENHKLYGTGLYAASKIYNEHQAEWFNSAYNMQIVGVRPAHVTGTDKISGSTEHVRCIVEPSLGRPVVFEYKDNMYALIHVEDIAEIFVKVTLAESTKFTIYNSGGVTTSLGQLSDIVKSFLPDSDISFKKETGGKDLSFIYMMDNTRLQAEFNVVLPPLEQRVKEMINDIRKREGFTLVK